MGLMSGGPVQSMPFMEQPGEILVPLLPYQRQFLAWGVSQEQSSVRGGILADEMGMGKTLQVSMPAASIFCRGTAFSWGQGTSLSECACMAWECSRCTGCR